jgi:hypothetical protein
MFFTPPPYVYVATVEHHAQKESNIINADLQKTHTPTIQQIKWHCSKEDAARIADIITTLANNGKLSLLMSHKTRLERIGDEITANPLQFLQVIIENTELKNCLRKIQKDHFIWSNFTSNMGRKLDSFKQDKNFSKYLKQFCHDLKIPINEITPYLEKRDYKGFIHKLSTY